MKLKFRPLWLRTHWFFILIAMVILFQVSGCGFFKGSASKEMDRTPESLIAEGLDAYQRKKYEKAIEAFQKLKDRFPYNQYAIVAELKLADSYFLNKDYALAATAYKEFEKLHPANEVTPYIIFQLGLCYFKEMPTIDRDQSFASQATREFERLLKTYPKSEYAKQAQDNLVAAQKNLVLHEYHIGEFYFKNKKYAAALGRFEGIIKLYPGVPHPKMMDNYIQICKNNLAQAQTPKAKTP